VCSYVAHQYPKSDIVGVELNIVLRLYSRIYQRRYGPENLHLVYENLKKYDIKSADVIYTY